MSLSQPIRVMLVDDHAMVRRGLATFLKVYDDLELVGEADSGEAAVLLCGQVLPDVILMDLMMPDMDGAATTRLIRQQFPNVQVVTLTSFKEEQMVQNALQAGAIGICSKMCRRMSWLEPSVRRMQGAPPCLQRLPRRWSMLLISRPRQATI